jgi:hypothetical protein
MSKSEIKNEIVNENEDHYIQSESDDEKLLINDIILFLNIQDDKKIDYKISRELKHDHFDGAFQVLIYQKSIYTLSILYFNDDDSCIIINLNTNEIICYSDHVMTFVTNYMKQLYELVEIENDPNNYILK